MAKRVLGPLVVAVLTAACGGEGIRRVLHVSALGVSDTAPSKYLRSKMAGEAGTTAGDVIAFGHTHLPWHRVVDGMHFVNAGSVGRPKDGDWRACYALLGIDGMGVGVEFRRVEYDLSEAMRGIRASTLPHEFADYLQSGGRTMASLTLPPVMPKPNAPAMSMV